MDRWRLKEWRHEFHFIPSGFQVINKPRWTACWINWRWDWTLDERPGFCHCCHPGPSFVFSPLDYHHNLQLPPLPLKVSPQPASQSEPLKSQITSLLCSKPSSGSHFTQSKIPNPCNRLQIPLGSATAKPLLSGLTTSSTQLPVCPTHTDWPCSSENVPGGSHLSLKVFLPSDLKMSSRPTDSNG